MEPRIETLPETKLLGKKARMSYARNRTKELWQDFMPKRGAITNTVGTNLYSVEIYDIIGFFKQFDPAGEFEKWAAVQVSDYETVLSEIEKLAIPAGLYVVFNHQGKASKAAQFYQYIYGSWIPNSDYQ